MVTRALITEDDDIVADAIVRALEAADFKADKVANANAALQRLNSESYDIAIVDIGLPGTDGITLVRRLRSVGKALPVLILTARDSLGERVRALELGADDFLGKPFEPAELVARSRALIRRSSANAYGSITLNRLHVDLNGRCVTYDNKPVELTAREWTLFECLVRNIGKIVTKDRLAQVISSTGDGAAANTVEAHVSRLRAKLCDAVVIRSLRGLGYRLEESNAP